MDLISLMTIIVLIGVALYAINTYATMDGKVKAILNILVITVLVVWLLRLFVPHIHIPVN